jgi:molecular chaperone GrpE
MTDPNRQNDDPADTAEPVVSKPYIMPDDPEEGSVEALTKEAAESRDKMLRTLAEMENLRKRTSKEVADARTYGITGFARDILDIADNLQRALDAVPAEAKESADPGLKAAQHAGEKRRQEIRSVGREVRPEFPAGDV